MNRAELFPRPEDVEIGGARLLASLRHQPDTRPQETLTDDSIDVLRAACAQLDSGDGQEALRNADVLHDHLRSLQWPAPDFEERAELICDCCFAAWRVARRARFDGPASVWWNRLGSALGVPSPLRFAVDSLLDDLLSNPAGMKVEECVADSQTVAGLCLRLDFFTDSNPQRIREAGPVLYRILEGKAQDELTRESRFLTGEVALRTGVACRMLGLRTEARLWLDRADAIFLRYGLEGDRCRARYQRLAVEMEDRLFERVLPQATELVHRFTSLGMQRDVLKTRILLGAVRKEMGDLDEAMETLQGVCRDAEANAETYLQCIAAYNIMQIHCWRGHVQNATAEAERLLPLLSDQENLVGVAKLLWGLGTLLANQHQFREGIEILRAAQTAFKNLDMNGDAAAIHLVIAEVLLGRCEEEAAVEEIKAALPIIKELRLLPEAIAAAALLQDSLSQRGVNKEALRKLRQFFPASLR